MDDLDPPPVAVARQLGVDARPVAHQQDRGAVLGHGPHGALHRGLRRMIPTHGVYGDRHVGIGAGDSSSGTGAGFSGFGLRSAAREIQEA